MFTSLLIAAAAAAQSPVFPNFLTGCWEERRKAGWTEECWTDGRGGVMLGTGRGGGDEAVAEWEWMRFERSRDGTITFHASVRGAETVPFTAVESSDRSITFVNAAHDYPQRVRYRLTADGLVAEVSLADGSKRASWTYRRTARAPK
jgi:hypothetical protein